MSKKESNYRPRNCTDPDYFSRIDRELRKMEDPNYTVTRVVRGTGETKSVTKNATEEFNRNLREVKIEWNS